jgi:molybdopterin-guanine dinucleotide biosynthesis protein B
VDLVLVEGFKTHPYPKLEVHRPALGKPPIWPEQRDVVAVATDAALTCDRTLLPLNEPARVAEWTLRFLESTAYIQQSLSG